MQERPVLSVTDGDETSKKHKSAVLEIQSDTPAVQYFRPSSVKDDTECRPGKSEKRSLLLKTKTPELSDNSHMLDKYLKASPLPDTSVYSSGVRKTSVITDMPQPECAPVPEARP